MLKNIIILLTVAGACLGSVRAAETPIPSGVYKILSGTFIKCCGIAGAVKSPLPDESQSFVRLEIDPQTHLARMAFLGQDMSTVFSIVPCSPGNPIDFSFDYGFTSFNQIVFLADPGPPPYSESWHYTVSNSVDALRIEGTLGINSQLCADVPNQFTQSNVVAVLMPSATIRVSEVEVCWNAASNRNYQVQYRAALTTNDWLNLGPPVAGNGTTNCISDKVAVGQEQRLYRVLAVP